MKINYVWILTILFVISSIGVLGTYNPDLNLPYDEYNFQIFADGNNNAQIEYLRNFNIEYNFEKELGEIHFRYFSDSKSKAYQIIVATPKELLAKNISLKEDSGKVVDYSKCIITSDGVYCYFNQTINDALIFNISIEQNPLTEFVPNGVFILNSDILDITPKESGLNVSINEYNTIFKFNFGKKYSCKDPCLTMRYSQNENIYYYLENNKVYIGIKPNHENNQVNPLQFRINTYDRKKEVVFNLIFIISISLITGILLIVVEQFFITNKNKIKTLICSPSN